MDEKSQDWKLLIQNGIAREVSDVYLTGGQTPAYRIEGEVTHVRSFGLTDEVVESALREMITEHQYQVLQNLRELDFSWTFSGRRFRGNAYYQRGHLAIVLRLLPARIPAMAEIGSPVALRKLIGADRGLILVCGRTGSGKTTTLASFVDEVNHQRGAHIITLEDPIEYLHQPERCFISQREWGRDFLSFSQAMRSALRESPDIILLGEIRDQDTMRTALMAAEAGILVLGTLHTGTAADTVRRIEGMFPLNQRDTIRDAVAGVLIGIFAQKLLPRRGGGRVCLTEVLLAEPSVQNLIRQGKYNQLDSVMLCHQRDGMQTRGQALDRLYAGGLITRTTREEEAGRCKGGGCV